MRYYISSRPVATESLLQLVRGHWGTENGLHRTLDVQFREDDCRLRRGHAPAVMGILRRAAMNLVRTVQQHFRSDLSIGLPRDKIGRNSALLALILTWSLLFGFPGRTPRPNSRVNCLYIPTRTTPPTQPLRLLEVSGWVMDLAKTHLQHYLPPITGYEAVTFASWRVSTPWLKRY